MNSSNIHVFWVQIPEGIRIEDINQWKNILDYDEQITFEKYRVEFKKIEFLTGRLLLKKVIGQVLSIPLINVVFDKTEYGKLILKEHLTDKPFFFNLSHTNGMVVCVLSFCQEVGVDVEGIERDCLEIMSKVFLPDEIRYVESQTSIQRKLKAFYVVWTRKEAVVKALGTGFFLDPMTFEVPIYGNRDSNFAHDFYTFQLLDNYIVTVVALKRMGMEQIFDIEKIDFEDLYK